MTFFLIDFSSRWSGRPAWGGEVRMTEDAFSCGTQYGCGTSVGRRCIDRAYVSCEFALCLLLNQIIALKLGSAQRGRTWEAVAGTLCRNSSFFRSKSRISRSRSARTGLSGSGGSSDERF
jgi:hypothetical protein